MDARPLYEAYIRSYNQSLNSGSENSPSVNQAPLSFDEFQSLPFRDQLASAQQGGMPAWGDALNQVGNARLDANDPLVQQFIQQYGSRPDSGVELANTPLTGYEMGYGDPTGAYGPADASRVLRLPDGSYIMESSNRDPNAIVAEQSRQNESGLGDGTRWAITGLSAVLGGGLLNNYLTAGNLAGEAAGSATIQDPWMTEPGFDAPVSPDGPIQDPWTTEPGFEPPTDSPIQDPWTTEPGFEPPTSAPPAGNSPFNLQNGFRALNGLRSLLGGGQRGGNPLMGGVGNPQPSVLSGFRKESLDKALATANHGLLPQDPMEKVKQAMMARQQPEKNPWDYQA